MPPALASLCCFFPKDKACVHCFVTSSLDGANVGLGIVISSPVLLLSVVGSPSTCCPSPFLPPAQALPSLLSQCQVSKLAGGLCAAAEVPLCLSQYLLTCMRCWWQPCPVLGSQVLALRAGVLGTMSHPQSIAGLLQVLPRGVLALSPSAIPEGHGMALHI